MQQVTSFCTTLHTHHVSVSVCACIHVCPHLQNVLWTTWSRIQFTGQWQLCVLLKIKTPELKLISHNAVAAAGIQTHQIPNCKSTTNRQHFKHNDKSSTGHIPWTDRVITVVDYCKSKRFCSWPRLCRNRTEAKSAKIAAISTLSETLSILCIHLNLLLNLFLVNDYRRK